ncbi:ABC-2 family transporter protein [Candidatus Woesebacteria bacterium]|nr:ABC-2 family transporter protein [Candidatus Woesebacteria bacterium]
MWRIRNILQIFLIFFLWDSVFSEPQKTIFSYDRPKILTYVFSLLFVRAIVLTSQATEISGQVARGDISSLLLKPVGFFKYWLTRDVSKKIINVCFAFFEGLILYLILKPQIYIQTNPIYLLLFMISLIMAFFIFYFLVMANNSIPFWVPEAAWGVNFILISVLVEFLSGAVFPLNVLPVYFQNLLSYTPFPYLVFFPIQIYLGNFSYIYAIKGIIVSGVWLFLICLLVKILWDKGLRTYQAQGS